MGPSKSTESDQTRQLSRYLIFDTNKYTNELQVKSKCKEYEHLIDI